MSPVKSILPIQSGQSLCSLGIDLRDEVLVAREDHDDDEGAGQRQVDQRQDAENDVGFGRRPARAGRNGRAPAAPSAAGSPREIDQGDIERRQEPAAREQEPFQKPLDHRRKESSSPAVRMPRGQGGFKRPRSGRDAGADRAGDAGAAEAAIAARVLGEVLLVVVLGEVERPAPRGSRS